MTASANDPRFTDTISVIYEVHLVPLLFAPYAPMLVERLVGSGP